MTYKARLSVITILLLAFYCDQVYSECELDCQGGKCLETKNPNMPYICACQDGSYSNSSCIQLANSTGIQSRRLIAVCEHTFCGQVGICIILDATFACVCPDGTIGENCLTSVIQPYCGCLNEGVCNQVTGTCVCPSGYSGSQCEISSSTDLCRDVTCRNGGVCNVISPGYATCWCLLGFDGDFCERRSGASTCSTLQCLNSGTCYEHSPASTIFAYCLCRPGFTGQRCEAEYFRCPSNGCFADPYGCAQGKYFECVETAIITSRTCPRGLRYNFFLGRCDYSSSVACPAL